MKLSAISTETRNKDRIKSAKTLPIELKGTEKVGENEGRLSNFLDFTLSYSAVGMYYSSRKGKGRRTPKVIQRSSGLPLPPQTQCAQALGKGRTRLPPPWFRWGGPLPLHKAPVWLGPPQKALALPIHRRGVNRMSCESDFTTPVGQEDKALNQEGLFFAPLHLMDLL